MLRIGSLALVGLLASSGVAAQAADLHSTLAIIDALSTPIPAVAVQEAQEFHDAFLASGDFEGVLTFLVTDERADRLGAIVDQLLEAIGEDPRHWQVRLLDSDPKVTNAFVTGGKYAYVFTGLTEKAESEDELAFVLSHELGHSLLKHNIRREQDWSQQLARIAELAGAVAGGNKGRSLRGVSRQITASYSRIDEEESDALAVFIARRGGFNPLRGADFFTRNARDEQRAQNEANAQLQRLYADHLAARNNCERLIAQWNADPYVRTQQNAILANNACNDAEARRVHYNRTLASVQLARNEAQIQGIFSTHPPDRQRVAAVAALSDHLEGRRDIFSLGEFEQTQRVVGAVRQARTDWLEPPKLEVAEEGNPESAPNASTIEADSQDRIERKLRRLKAMLDEGLITQADYERKKQALIDSL